MAESVDPEVEAAVKEVLTPNPDAPKRFRELGSTGIKRTGGFIQEEILPELLGPRGREKYREMAANEPVLHGLMYTFEMLFRSAKRTVRPAESALVAEHDPSLPEEDSSYAERVPGTTQRPSTSEEAEVIAAFIDEALDDLAHSFSAFMGQIASQFKFGWAFHEIVYKRREGYNPRSHGKSSRYDDGLIGWKRFAFRDQRTLTEWVFDKHGRVQAFKQYDPYSDQPTREQPIPLRKGLLWNTLGSTIDPEGRSLLRGAYRSWYFKKRLEEIEAIGIERDLAGMPVISAPAEIMGPEASEEGAALFEMLKRTVQNIRRDEQDGLVFPIQYDDDGNELYKFQLASTGGQRQIDINETIRRKNMEMAMSVLSDFMMLGHENVGSFALSQDKTNLFTLAVDGFLTSVADTFMRHAVPRLMALNDMPLELAPIITFESVRAPTLTELGEFVQRLARAGAPFFPDDRLQDWFHERAGMPPSLPQAEAVHPEGNDGSAMQEGEEQQEEPPLYGDQDEPLSKLPGEPVPVPSPQRNGNGRRPGVPRGDVSVDDAFD